MPDRKRIGLDNPAFRGRLRQPSAGAQSLRARNYAGYTSRTRSSDIVVASTARSAPKKQTAVDQLSQTKPKSAKVAIIVPQPYARPAHPKQMQSKVLHRQAVNRSVQSAKSIGKKKNVSRKYSVQQLALTSMACFIFLFGLSVSLITLQTNRSAHAQVAAIAEKTVQEDGAAAADAPPTETQPSRANVTSYQVAPDTPRHIKIAKLDVYARIRPMAVNNKNEMQAPASIYDTGWYNASAKPGDSGGNGAMVINGHVHGPTMPGVFVNLKKLVAGDSIEVTRGDGTTFVYEVVKSVVYDVGSFDMAAALTSAQPGKHGLNLITCSGPYDKDSGEYTQRTIVFAVQRS